MFFVSPAEIAEIRLNIESEDAKLNSSYIKTYMGDKEIYSKTFSSFAQLKDTINLSSEEIDKIVICIDAKKHLFSFKN